MATLVDSEGRKTYLIDPIQAKSHWPDVSVDSGQFEELSLDKKLYEQAIAFLGAAKTLCKAIGSAGKSGKPITWSQGSVCNYCLTLAIELFLKACILKGTGQAAAGNHDIPALLKKYGELLPDRDFHFQVPPISRHVPSEIEKVLGHKVYNPIDKTPDQLYRYGFDKRGEGSAGIHIFHPDILFNRIIQYEKVWPRAWEAAKRG